MRSFNVSTLAAFAPSSEPTQAEADFANMLFLAREAANLSVREVAAITRSSPDVVRSWEAATEIPPFRAFGRLAAALPVLRPLRAALRALWGEEAAEVAFEAPLTFPDHLRALRVRDRLEQEDVADLVGVTSQAVSAWETDAARPVVDHWRLLLAIWPELESTPPESRDIPPPTGGSGPRGPVAAPTAARRDPGAATPAEVPPEPVSGHVVPPSPVDSGAHSQSEYPPLPPEGPGVHSQSEYPPLPPELPAHPQSEYPPSGDPTMNPTRSNVTPLPLPPLPRDRLVAWVQILFGLATSPGAPEFLALLERASADGMTVDDLVLLVRSSLAAKGGAS